MRRARNPVPTPAPPSISLHVDHLVLDESLLGAGREREFRHALFDALERTLADTVHRGNPAAVGTARQDRPVAGGSASVLADGVAERVVGQVVPVIAAERRRP